MKIAPRILAATGVLGLLALPLAAYADTTVNTSSATSTNDTLGVNSGPAGSVNEAPGTSGASGSSDYNAPASTTSVQGTSGDTGSTDQSSSGTMKTAPMYKPSY